MKKRYQRFLPSFWAGSISELSPAYFLEKGIKGVICDIDNTLVAHGAPASEAALCFLKNLTDAGIRVCLVSNNSKNRVAPFAKAANLFFISRAAKPLGFAYRRAMAQMGTLRANTAVVGDQLFSDIWGGKRLGLHTVLVSPIEKSKSEGRFVAAKRKLEERVLSFYGPERPNENHVRHR